MRGKLTISWDELSSPAVDQRLARQAEAERAAAEVNPADFVPVPVEKTASSFWYNSLVYMSIFGLLGGLLGWGLGELLHLRPNAKAEARELIDAQKHIVSAQAAMRLTQAEAEAATRQLRRVGRNNPYFLAWSDPALTEPQRRQAIAELENRDAWKDFFANMMFYGAAGMMLAAFLGMADAAVGRNMPVALANGTIGATVGLLGGVVVALFVDRLHHLVVGSIDAEPSLVRLMLARAVSWGVLGAFLSLAPGILMRSGKNLLVGVAGGLLGGIVGGLLFDPIAGLTGEQVVSRLVGLITIGLISGLATGLIESAAKTGWLKVTAGWIAGKQFVVYRNPTYIGSSLQCSVYLFKDPQVGRRHAAIHVVPGAFEIEDLPLGTQTLVNGKPIKRCRLRHGDRIQVGQTAFLFQQKEKKT